MERAFLLALSDDELVDLIESLDAAGYRRRELAAALEELFRRLRAEAAPMERARVERVIDRLGLLFSQDEDDAGPPQSAGVREPRRPPPDVGAGTIHLAS